ncbi:OmpA family protein [Altererythrobacter sp. MF3-039]|uniref:OmpA family protein n=1 Tax=Altererythrobacter sp. MF3-039 TaxID=3252901 RepID=UPI00390CAEC2
MSFVSKGTKGLALFAALTLPMSASLYAQDQVAAETVRDITVEGMVPTDLSGFPEGPEIEGFISARALDRMQVTGVGGTNTTVSISEATEVRAKGGFLGLNRNTLDAGALLNGLPVTVETVRWNQGLIATRVKVSNKNLETAAMIQAGTNQRFSENEAAIDANAAATEALRGRVANIDQYNIKGTTNVYFDTGKWNLKPGAARELCDAANQANNMDNALLLVVGYTDSVGNEDYNQVLSERRAGRVVNYLQQKCSWQPWRMMTPTGMAESDPLADNSTAEGRAQNRRVSVNILVSKALEEG